MSLILYSQIRPCIARPYNKPTSISILLCITAFIHLSIKGCYIPRYNNATPRRDILQAVWRVRLNNGLDSMRVCICVLTYAVKTWQTDAQFIPSLSPSFFSSSERIDCRSKVILSSESGQALPESTHITRQKTEWMPSGLLPCRCSP